MSESNTPRLMAAAKEFNIGKDTLVDFLVGKGFSKDDLKPTSKLTEDMYYSLQQEFSSDKAAKAKSDAIEIPKGAAAEVKKKKDEEEIVFKKESKKKAETPKAAEPPVEKVKIDAPELDGPKILDKIDLEALDTSTRPKKSSKKKEPAPEVVEEPVKQVKEPVEEPEKKPVEQEIERVKIEAPELEGPKIIGKIELAPETDEKGQSADEKRKRKRIPIEKKRSRASKAFYPKRWWGTSASKRTAFRRAKSIQEE